MTAARAFTAELWDAAAPIHDAILRLPFNVELAAGYRDVGNAIHRRAAPDNPYRRWIDTYAGEEFVASVDRTIALTDEVAATASEAARDAMRAAYVTSSRLEWMFWDSAYRMERWPP